MVQLAYLAASEQGLDPKLLNESCRQASPSQVRDACGPRDGNEHARRAIASDGVHSAQQYGPAGFVLQLPTHRSAMSFCQGDRKEVRLGNDPDGFHGCDHL
jgi:hypothetical protein